MNNIVEVAGKGSGADKELDKERAKYQEFCAQENGYHVANLAYVCTELGYNPRAVAEVAETARANGILIHIGGMPFGAFGSAPLETPKDDAVENSC